jgi:glycosyltransferase involved in cell wall biosynthesis
MAADRSPRRCRHPERTFVKPVVSIVMPTFNRLEFLPATVESVLAQTMPSWELMIADDGSSAETLAYLGSLTRDRRIRLLRLPHSGNAGTARNAAIAAASTDLLAFLDSDDLWAPRKLARQLAVLRANPASGWSYTAFVMIDAQGEPLPSERYRPWVPHHGRIFAETVRTTASIRPSSVIAKTDLVKQVGAFDEAIDCSEDYDLWMRLALQSPACVVDAPLAYVRRHSSNPKRRAGGPHLARDYSLRKLADQLDGRERRLLVEERSRNALGLAGALLSHGQRRRAIAAVGKGLALGWRYPRWWFGAAKMIAKALVGRPRTSPATRLEQPSSQRDACSHRQQPD